MENEHLRPSIEWLLGLSKKSHELEAFALDSLQVLQARPGYNLCRFVVSNRILDERGNWAPGAMATLIDVVGASAIYSLVGTKISVDICVSYFSPPKFQDEVEIESKVTGEKDTLTCVIVEVRRKENGELVALGKQWMAFANKSSKL